MKGDTIWGRQGRRGWSRPACHTQPSHGDLGYAIDGRVQAHSRTDAGSRGRSGRRGRGGRPRSAFLSSAP